ncbi:Transmembrane emp24 domain-containing protein 7 [Fasciola gigantica]|uniref:Transmembrane emp24 domain-containing protein 7 n=1 Tax=Fasciola gigantica TaxID=46835 RepID=A0A504YKH2_FASGI|nr:Transmembrane emp24 domain-containing protein 7 [Fasciola gigantica]
MLPVWRLCFLLLIDFCLVFAYPKRFTIEIPDGETFCAYENLYAQKKYSLMYQVIHSGNLDVHLIIRDPMKQTIHETKHGSHEDIKFDSHVNGAFEFCFGNEFSSLSEKLVYFELRPDPYETLTVLTMVQSALESAHLYLSHAESTQIELRNRELGDRLVAEDLNQAVLYWSIAVTIAIFVTTLGQVTILKNFFADKKVFYSTRASRM